MEREKNLSAANIKIMMEGTDRPRKITKSYNNMKITVT